MQTLIQNNKHNEDITYQEIYGILLRMVEDHDQTTYSIKMENFQQMMREFVTESDNQVLTEQFGKNRNFRKLCMSLAYQGIISFPNDDTVILNGSTLYRLYNL